MSAAHSQPNLDELIPSHAERPPAEEPGGESVSDTTSTHAQSTASQADRPWAVELVSAGSIRPQHVRWVWQSRIPAGMGSLMAGQEGTGKTALVGHLMARLTRGELDGDWLGRPAHVVYIGAEDDPASVLVPRLTAAGADLERVHFLSLPHLFDASDAAALAKGMAELDEVAMVVVDPLDAHLGAKVDTHRKSEVQRSYIRLVSELTGTQGCAVVGIAHLSKGDSYDVLKRVVGSVGFTTTARSVLAVGEHDDYPGDRLCVVRKANMEATESLPALRFRVVRAEVPHPDGAEPITTAGVEIVGEESGVDPNALLTTLARRTAREEAEEWLREYLADGPRPSAEVKEAAAKEGISRTTLARSRDSLGVLFDEDHTKQGIPTTWRLPRGDDGGPDGSGPLGGGVGTKPGTKPDVPLTRGNGAADEVSFQDTGSGTKPKSGERKVDLLLDPEEVRA